MTKILFSTFLLAFTSIAIGQINFQDLSIDEAIEKAKAENKKVFIDVFTTWCGPCKVIDKNVFKKAEIGDRMNPDYISIKVDAERYPDQVRFNEFRVRAYPTMIILNGEGREMKRIRGAISIERFHKLLDGFIDPALLPQNIALKEMSENQDNEVVWRKNMAILLKKDERKFEENSQVFVDRFGLNALNNKLDSNIFYHSILPMDGPIAQRILADNEFMMWYQETYQILDLRERARTAPTKTEYDAIIDEAKALHAQFMIDNYNDYIGEESFLEGVFPEDLNPMYLQQKSEMIVEKETVDNCKSRRKKRREERRIKRESK
ncbi:MAG: DUF255 domain-containing protein [Crocinitomicaceae bacterium]|nr:DUF255 domain-containing protein [Flavobacteriales bacterium]NQZ35361.1 DUF255 domain-containing protein [Crocinitomicaceae bacterium]